MKVNSKLGQKWLKNERQIEFVCGHGEHMTSMQGCGREVIPPCSFSSELDMLEGKKKRKKKKRLIERYEWQIECFWSGSTHYKLAWEWQWRYIPPCPFIEVLSQNHNGENLRCHNWILLAIGHSVLLSWIQTKLS